MCVCHSDDMVNTTGCVTDAQFVQDAILELRRSRHALMSSYAYGYFIERHMERELFEELQVNRML